MILVFMEVRDGGIKKSSLEALSEASRKTQVLHTEAAAVLAGHNLERLADKVFPYGASKAYLLENTLLSHYSPSAVAQALSLLIDEVKPEIVFFSATAMGRDLAPRLAAKLGVSLASDCTRIEIMDGKLEVVRPIYAKLYHELNIVSYSEPFIPFQKSFFSLRKILFISHVQPGMPQIFEPESQLIMGHS